MRSTAHNDTNNNVYNMSLLSIDKHVKSMPLLKGTDATEFRDYAFVLKAVLNMADNRLPSWMDTATTLDTPVEQPADDQPAAEASRTLYFVLCMTCKDHSQVIIQQVENGHGFEAWRRLSRALDPMTGARGSPC